MMDFNDAEAPTEPRPERPSRDAIRAQLLQRLEGVLQALYPNGRVRRDKFHLGNIQGEKGDSLEVELSGPKAGLWTDHATGEGGDVFDLIAKQAGLDVRHDFAAVLARAADLAGHAPVPSPAAPRPRRRAEPVLDELGPATARWDYLSADGELIACVYRYDPPTGKEYRPWDAKRRKHQAPEPRPLYNQPGLAAELDVVVVEGEKAADALIALDVPATTAMNGAKAPVEKTDWSPLRGKHVLIWPDKDKAGWDYALAVAHAALAAGAISCAILYPPEDKEQGWDAADAVEEHFDVIGFLRAGERTPITRPERVEAVDFGELGWHTDDGLATAFTNRYHEDWRYCAAWGQWMVWSGQRWNPDRTLTVNHLVRGVCRVAATYANTGSQQARLASASTVSAVERMARSDRYHASDAEEWDTRPWLLNSPAGTIDLKTGLLRKHARIDRLTRMATAGTGGECSLWRRFLADVTGGDGELQAYLQRMAGYCLTGVTTEHALFFLYGTGANGKSVFVNTLAAILGDYATSAPMDTFMESRGERHPTELAGLRGARFVAAVETEEGRRWNESKLKVITGGDKIMARFMRQDFFEYTPQFKLVIAGNHKPAIRNVDEAMKRRLHLIPFTVTVPPERRDGDLPKKLLAEREGVLAWAVEGCLQWQRLGLKPPKSVLDATDEYFESEDALGRWIEERCQEHSQSKALIADLFVDWKDWSMANGEFAGSIKRFSEMLESRRYGRHRGGKGARYVIGLSLRPKSFARYVG